MIVFFNYINKNGKTEDCTVSEKAHTTKGRKTEKVTRTKRNNKKDKWDNAKENSDWLITQWYPNPISIVNISPSNAVLWTV